MMAVWQQNYFEVAGHLVGIHFCEGQPNGMPFARSFEPFRTECSLQECVTEMFVDDTLSPVPQERRKRIRAFDTGNGDTIVDRVDDGGWQFIIKDIKGRSCCLLIADASFQHCRCALNGDAIMRAFGLNNALMLAYAYATVERHTLLLHASLVRYQDLGYAFIAKSGTGKSTQVAMWLRCIPGCDLMNDDNPIVRMVDGEAWIYGSPWSGKTPCYRNVRARLGAITRIERSQENFVERLLPVQAFASLLPSCSSMKWDAPRYGKLCDTVSRVIEATSIYTLHCLPNEDAAKICRQAIVKEC